MSGSHFGYRSFVSSIALDMAYSIPLPRCASRRLSLPAGRRRSCCYPVVQPDPDLGYRLFKRAVEPHDRITVGRAERPGVPLQELCDDALEAMPLAVALGQDDRPAARACLFVPARAIRAKLAVLVASLKRLVKLGLEW